MIAVLVRAVRVCKVVKSHHACVSPAVGQRSASLVGATTGFELRHV